MIHLSARFRYGNKMMNSALEFWKIKLKELKCLRLNLKKKTKMRTCDLNLVSES